MIVSHQFDKAFAYAVDLHRAQVRKGITIPYIANLTAVSPIILEYGGDSERHESDQVSLHGRRGTGHRNRRGQAETDKDNGDKSRQTRTKGGKHILASVSSQGSSYGLNRRTVTRLASYDAEP